MANARKLSNGKWEMRVNLGRDELTGKYIQHKFIGNTKNEVLQRANDYKNAYALNVLKSRDPVHYMTLGEAMNAYIEIKHPVLSPTTIAGYQKIMKNDFLDIQDYHLCNLTLDLIQNSVNTSASRASHNANCKNGLSKKSLKNACGFLSAVLKRYYPEFRFSIDIPRGNVNEHDNTLLDLTTLIHVITGTNIELAVWLGLLSFRASEICGLRKCDCDLEHGYITLKQTIVEVNNERIVRNCGKTEKSLRTIKLPNHVVELIKTLPENQEYLVPERKKTFTLRFSKLLEHNNLPHMRFHDLRHLNASITQSLGIDDKIRQEIGGWSSPEIMNKTYTHILSNDRIISEEKLINYLDNCYHNCQTTD